MQGSSWSSQQTGVHRSPTHCRPRWHSSALMHASPVPLRPFAGTQADSSMSIAFCTMTQL